MARTIQQIFDSMVTAKEADTRLAALTSPSATSLWRLLFYVVATATWAHETLWDAFRTEVDGIVARAAVGTPGWYVEQLLDYREGSQLQVVDNVVRYPESADGARIIARATARVAATGTLFLKVARAGTEPGTLQALTSAQLVAVTSYIKLRGFAGVRVEVVSREADRLKVEATVYYDGMRPLDGATGVRTQVVAALDAALAAVPFDGALLQSKLEDAMQSVHGVQDVAIRKVTARAGLQEYPPTRVGRWDTQAGYVVQDEIEGATFADTLTFVPYV